MDKSYSNLESLTLKCAQKSLKHFKTASVDKVGYLKHLDLDAFKTVVIRFDGEIVLFNEFIKGCEKIKLDNKRKELADRIKNIDKIMTNEDLDKILNNENAGFGYIFDTNEIIILKSNTGT